MQGATSNKKKVVITGPINFARTFPSFQAKFDVVQLQSGADLFPHVVDANAILVKMHEQITEQVVNSCPKLEVVARHGAGYDNVHVASCKQRKIWVTNTPDVIAPATADIALLHLLNLSRKFSESERWLREGNFAGGSTKFLGNDPEYKTLGILGMGAIGKKLAVRAAALDMKIVYHNRTRLPEAEEKQFGNAVYLTKDELFAQSDFISVNVPHNAQTFHLLGPEEFKKMKTGVFIINTARGPIINEQALVDAIKNGKVAGAGLDVFEEEPKVHPELYKLPNVSLTPHIGTATVESRRGMEELALANIEAVLDGKPPINPVPECADLKQ